MPPPHESHHLLAAVITCGVAQASSAGNLPTLNGSFRRTLRWKPLTALNRYRGLQAFFKWAVAEGELDACPMAGMNPPQIPDEPPPVLTDEELRRLLKSCEGRDFTDRRDAAILRLFLDTGVRVAEAAGIMLPGDLVPAVRETAEPARTSASPIRPDGKAERHRFHLPDDGTGSVAPGRDRQGCGACQRSSTR
jgi:hypothetical protein